MKKVRFFVMSALALSLMASCSSSSNNDAVERLRDLGEELKEETPAKKYTTEEIDGLYSIDVPLFMTSTTILNDDASAQFMNMSSEKYFIVINEPISDFGGIIDESNPEEAAKQYADIQYGFFKDGYTVTREGDLKEIDLKGDVKGFYRKVDGEIENAGETVRIAYWLAYFASDDNVYYSMVWTLKDRQSGYKEEAMHILESFKEL